MLLWFSAFDFALPAAELGGVRPLHVFTMSKVKSPTEKKRFAYERDHYNRNGESNKAWRKIKPSKKAKARRAFRKASKDLLQVAGSSPENAQQSIVRKQGSIEQRRVEDWGSIHLQEFVATRRVRNQTTGSSPLPHPGA